MHRMSPHLTVANAAATVRCGHARARAVAVAVMLAMTLVVAVAAAAAAKEAREAGGIQVFLTHVDLRQPCLPFLPAAV